MLESLDSIRRAYWNVRYWDRAFAWRLFRTVRIGSFLRCLWLFPIRQPNRPASTRLVLRDGPTVWLRTYSSDPTVFKQVFVDQQYAAPGIADDVRAVLDAGANVGLATVYFLIRYPEASVVALEPDPDNFRQATKNLESFGDRVTLLPLALWSGEAVLDLSAGRAGWESSVHASSNPTHPVRATSIAGALRARGWESVDIAKIDIEGAETELLADPVLPLARHARCWAFELHSELARRQFDQLFAEPDWRISTRDEITFAVCAA